MMRERAGPKRGVLSTKHRAHFGVELGGVVAFDHAELKFVGRGRGVARMYCVAVNQLIAPDTSIGKWSWDGTADAARIVFDDEFAQGPERHSR